MTFNKQDIYPGEASFSGLVAAKLGTNHAQSVVVGVDFSRCAESALKQAIRAARRSGVRLRVVHITDATSIKLPKEMLEGFRSEAMASLARQFRQARVSVGADAVNEAEAQIEVEVGRPASAILRRAEEPQTDLLVLGKSGVAERNGGLGRLAKACLRKASTNVLLVQKLHAGPFRSVVACIEASHESRDVLQHAMRFAKEDRAQLYVLSFIDSSLAVSQGAARPEAPDGDAFGCHLDEISRCMLDDTYTLRPEYHVLARAARTACIREFANQVKADLVVLKARGGRHLADLFLGPPAERLARQTTCSILIIPPDPG